MKNLIYETFNSIEGRLFIENALNNFASVIPVFEKIYNVKPFNQQTAQSLTELYLLVKALKPSTVFELGCGTRSSTFALSNALISGTVHGVDLSPNKFDPLMATFFPGIQHAPVIDHAINAIEFEIPDEWERPILTLYDAHDFDIPGIKIFPHAQKNWFPKLKGSIIAIHDCSVSLTKIDYPVNSDHYSCRHFSGRYISGFHEVIALTEWLNNNQVDFYRPGDDLKTLGFSGHDSSLICFEVL